MRKGLAFLLLTIYCMVSIISASAETPLPYDLTFGISKSDVTTLLHKSNVEPSAEYFMQHNGITSERIEIIEFENAEIFWFQSIQLVTTYLDNTLFGISFTLPPDNDKPNTNVVNAIRGYFGTGEYRDLNNGSWLYSFGDEEVSCSYGYMLQSSFSGENYNEQMQTTISFQEFKQYLEVLNVIQKEFF